MKYLLITICIGLMLSSCQSNKKGTSEPTLSAVAASDKQWTGVAVSQSGRVFVNYPFWSGHVPVSVAEIVNGVPRAYPNMEWNQRTNSQTFNAVQSVFIDDIDRLWVLDTNNPQFKGVNAIGPQLYHFNLESNDVVKVYNLPEGVYKSNSYFNDVRIDSDKNMAYMTDSGDGAIIVLDLNTGHSQRLLDEHPSTQNEVDHLVCDGIRWENSVHSDGIALSPDRQYLYYIALSGHTLYRIPTNSLLNESMSPESLAKEVEKVKKIPATDGMLFDKAGNLYLGGLETNSVNRLNKDGEVEKLMESPRIRWADSFALDRDGNLYFTTSQIHLPEKERGKYEVLKIQF
ncbi:L-dopachrome tautomerase-related protein [Carboxylicivirga marina]|uniref:SMP-30/gluconolactonase/LRE family protein n=1 Tax=Carboxylicivirga marina TaxID=2800988 RepID=A0ABS1HGG8_9BACT|nr:L-dopachrome tautomerase-related protein [Carboxylicivirga marina]MBK3516747.1 SMP-30/gluconolactonase/LRE family protein [Carboxylicivirga marina]